jgi:hypothetical protein
MVSGDTTAGPGSVEFWGDGSCSNNLVQGYWGAGMQYGFGGAPWQMINNIIQQLANTSYINNEENITCCYPVMTGNVESQKLAAVTSAIPTISVATGQSDSVTVTLTDTGVTSGGVGPQGNTTIYYTTNGTTPTTSSTVYSGAIAVSSGTVTIEALGAESGFTNSNVASATYTISSGGGTCVTATSGGSYQNSSMTAQTGTFTATCDATPTASPTNSVVALSNGAQTAYANFACLARFNPSGDIDARNGGAYAAASTIPYSANVSYHFRLVVNVSAQTYSIYVTPAGGSELTVGTNYAFRISDTTLNNWAVYVDSGSGGAGSVTVCNASP